MVAGQEQRDHCGVFQHLGKPLEEFANVAGVVFIVGTFQIPNEVRTQAGYYAVQKGCMIEFGIGRFASPVVEKP